MLITDDYTSVIRACRIALKQPHSLEEVVKICDTLHYAICQQYEKLHNEEKYEVQHKLCVVIDKNILPTIDKIIQDTLKMCTSNVPKEIETLLGLRKKLFAVSARRILKNFAFYIEQYSPKKIWDKTADTMSPVFYYLDIFQYSDVLDKIRISCMPGLGKSYCANLFVAQALGNNPNLTILRITYSEDLVFTTTKQTESILESQAFAEIFPRYKDMGKKILKTKNKYCFALCDCYDEFNLFAVTRDGQSTGKRAKLVIIDDLLKGEAESNNIALHKQLLNRYDSDWSSRADDDKQKIILMGTMWAHTDLLNVIYDREKEDIELVDDTKRKFTEVAVDGSSVFIGIPALDKKENSTCPRRFSTEKLKRKRKNMSRYLWQAVYQQDPIAPEGLEFERSLLKQYSKLPNGRLECVYASLDPARKGKNYVSMPIFAKFVEDEEEDYYVADWLYQKKSMIELYDRIVDKIIENGVQKLVCENNTDTSLAYVLETKLRERGYYGCIIIEHYSLKNKEKRINDNQGNIRGKVVYPDKNVFPPGHDVSEAMESLTSFSFSYPNKFDDAIDSVALFVMEFLGIGNAFATVETFDRSNLGI